jgi:hypothetical protein
MYAAQKNNTFHLRFCALSGALLDGVFGDKEIAVRIRGNSHYRNRGNIRFASQVGMLIGA